MNTILQTTISGLSTGAIYGLVAIGVTMVYGLVRLLNFAHGELVTYGAFACAATTAAGYGFITGLLAALVVGAGAGFALERSAFRFTRTRPINGLILSFGLAFVSQAVLYELYGDDTRSIPAPISGSAHVGEVIVSYQRLAVVATAVLMVACLFAFLKLTRFGTAVRAYAQDPGAAQLIGVNTDRLVLAVFMIGSGLAAVAGGLLVSLGPASRTLGTSFSIKAFIIAIVGGLGSPIGALAAGAMIGISEAVATAYISSGWTELAGLVVLVLVLLVRPSGLAAGGEGGSLH